MKINVLAYDAFIWTNQIRVNGESARASFDWLQGGPALPSRLQNSASERIVPKLQAQRKERRSCTYRVISGKSYALRTQHVVYTFATALFYTQRHILQSESVLQFSTPLFLLANCRLQTCKAFGRISAQKNCQKCKRGKNVGQKNTDHIYFKLIWSCSFSTHDLHLQNIVPWCKSGFLELITWFTPLQNLFCACKFILRLQCHLHFHKYYPAHANLFDVILPS